MKTVKKFIICFIAFAAVFVIRPKASSTGSLGQVMSVRQLSASEDSAAVIWEAVPGATHYAIYSADTGNQVSLVDRARLELNHTLKPGHIYGQYYIMALAYERGRVTRESETASEAFSFRTLPGKISSVNASYYDISKKRLKLTWSKVATADGYQVRVYSLKNGKKLCKNKNVGATSSLVWLKGISPSQAVKIEIRGYTLIGTDRKYGRWTTVYTAMASNVTIGKSKKSRTVKVSWKAVSGAARYELYISDNKLFGYKKLSKANKKGTLIGDYNGKPILSGRTYYVKLVPVIKVDGKSYKGLESIRSFIFTS